MRRKEKKRKEKKRKEKKRKEKKRKEKKRKEKKRKEKRRKKMRMVEIEEEKRELIYFFLFSDHTVQITYKTQKLLDNN